jgi:hypothetical protein
MPLPAPLSSCRWNCKAGNNFFEIATAKLAMQLLLTLYSKSKNLYYKLNYRRL